MTTATVWAPPLQPVWIADPAPLAVVTPPSRLRTTLLDPRTLTVLTVVGLIFVVGFRHAIASTIGTTGPDVAPLTGTTTQPVSPRPVLYQPRAEAAPPVRTHVPRDPFAPLTGATAEPVAATTASRSAVVTVTTTGAGSYRVRPGDSLWSIARRELGTGATTAAIVNEWKSIYAANRGVVGGNPSLVRAGIVLRIPEK